MSILKCYICVLFYCKYFGLTWETFDAVITLSDVLRKNAQVPVKFCKKDKMQSVKKNTPLQLK